MDRPVGGVVMDSDSRRGGTRCGHEGATRRIGKRRGDGCVRRHPAGRPRTSRRSRNASSWLSSSARVEAASFPPTSCSANSDESRWGLSSRDDLATALLNGTPSMSEGPGEAENGRRRPEKGGEDGERRRRTEAIFLVKNPTLCAYLLLLTPSQLGPTNEVSI